MRSKVIFVMLFMLSFSVMHDSIISYLQNNEQPIASHYAQLDDISSQEIDDSQKIHHMFHFVGVIVPCTETDVLPYEKTVYPLNLLQYTRVNKETSLKPPIA